MDYKVGDVIYYDKEELKSSIRIPRYKVCKILRIEKIGLQTIMLFGNWVNYHELPKPDEFKNDDDTSHYGWMPPDEVHLLYQKNKNRRIMR